MTATATRRGERFDETLAALPLVRPRYQTDAWTPLDAACFWDETYDPEAPNALPPMLVLGIVARWMMRNFFDNPLTASMVCQAHLDRRAIAIEADVVHFDWNRKIAELNIAWFPGSKPADAMVVGPPTGIRRSIYEIGHRDHHFYCMRKTCKTQDTWLGGCLEEHHFQDAVKGNLLVGWKSVQWGALGCLFPPLRNCLRNPVLSVKCARSHKVYNSIPVWVADGLASMQRVLPPLMRELRHSPGHMLVLSDYLGRVAGERLRYWGITASRADSAERMAKWDKTFTASVWMLGMADKVYEDHSYHFWGVPHDVYEQLCLTQDDDLFPEFPVPF